VFDIDNTYADGSTAESRFFDPHGLDVAADGKVLSQTFVSGDLATKSCIGCFAQQIWIVVIGSQETVVSVMISKHRNHHHDD
jgi:hypothetical protein